MSVERFGSYEVLGHVADGSTGRVFKARHVTLGRLAAIKVLKPEVVGLPGQADRLRSEAAVLASLDDPHVVALYDFVEEPDQSWLAQQWVDGVTLSAILDQHGTLTPEQALGVVRGGLQGLAHAHSRGVLHRDIAPGNILADEAGTSMLVDFGVAVPTGATTAEGVALAGTPAFISPEAIRGEALTPASDVYSVAGLLWLLLNGSPVFDATTTSGLIGAHLRTPAPRLTGHGDDLADLLARSLGKDPANRPQDAAAFLAELEQAAERRYGAGWLERSSITALVVSTIAAAGRLVAATAGAGAGASAAPPTVVVPQFSGSAQTTATKVGRMGVKLGAKQAVVAAVVTVVVVAGGGFGAKTYANHRHDVHLKQVAAAKKAKEVAFAKAAPSGQWTVTTVIQSSNFPNDKVGDKGSNTWTFAPACKAMACTGTVKSSSGKSFTFTWDDTTLSVIDTKPSQSQGGLCTDRVTHEKVPGTHFKDTLTYNLGPFTPSSSARPPTKFTATEKALQKTVIEGDCERDHPDYHNVIAFTLVKKG